MSGDPVSNPSHYKGDGMEAIDVLEGFGFGYHLGTAAAYLLRAGRKSDEIQDLKKARWYVERAGSLSGMSAAGPGMWHRSRWHRVATAFGLSAKRARIFRALVYASADPSFDLLGVAHRLFASEIADLEGAAE